MNSNNKKQYDKLVPLNAARIRKLEERAQELGWRPWQIETKKRGQAQAADRG